MKFRLQPGHDLEKAVKEAPEGAVIELEAGEYRLERGLYLSKSLTLRGQGPGLTRLVSSGEAYVLCFRGRGALVATGVAFAHEGPAWGDVVVADGGEVRLEQCTFSGAVHLEEAQRGGDGLVLGEATHGLVRDCDFSNNEANGIRLWGAAAPVLDGNRAFDNGWNGIVYFGHSGGIARDNRCERNGCNGIGVNGNAQVVTEGNTLLENGWNGLCYVDESGGAARRNHCERNEGADLYLAGPVRLRLEDNDAIIEVHPPEADDGVDTGEFEAAFGLLGGPLVEVLLGAGLTHMVDVAQGGDLLGRIGPLRLQLAEELGFVMPGGRVADDAALPAFGYELRVRHMTVARGELPPDHRLVVGPAGAEVPAELDGIAASAPDTGLSARWVKESRVELAHQLGFATLDASDVLLLHLGEVMRTHAHALLTREMVAHLLERLAERAPVLVEGLISERLTLATVQSVLQQLLRERVSLRDLPLVLERLSDAATTLKDPRALTERVREGLARPLCAAAADAQGVLAVLRLDARTERRLTRALAAGGPVPASLLATLVERLVVADVRSRAAGHVPVLVVGPALRPHLPPLLARALPRLGVLSSRELHPDFRLLELETVSDRTVPWRAAWTALRTRLSRPGPQGLTVRWVP